jgi:hypothetical protein
MRFAYNNGYQATIGMPPYQKRGAKEGDHERGKSIIIHYASWKHQDVQRSEDDLLVKQHEEVDCQVCGIVPHVPSS